MQVPKLLYKLQPPNFTESENRWKKKRHIMRSVNTLLSLSRIWGCSFTETSFKDRLLLNSASPLQFIFKMCLFWITLSMKSFFNADTFQTTVVSLDRSQLMACLVCEGTDEDCTTALSGHHSALLSDISESCLCPKAKGWVYNYQTLPNTRVFQWYPGERDT